MVDELVGIPSWTWGVGAHRSSLPEICVIQVSSVYTRSNHSWSPSESAITGVYVGGLLLIFR